MRGGVCAALGAPLPVALPVGEREGVLAPLQLALPVTEALAPGERLRVGGALAVTLPLAVGVGVATAVRVGDPMGDLEGVAEGVAGGVPLPLSLRRPRRTRRRPPRVGAWASRWRRGGRGRAREQRRGHRGGRWQRDAAGRGKRSGVGGCVGGGVGGGVGGSVGGGVGAAVAAGEDVPLRCVSRLPPWRNIAAPPAPVLHALRLGSSVSGHTQGVPDPLAAEQRSEGAGRKGRRSAHYVVAHLRRALTRVAPCDIVRVAFNRCTRPLQRPSPRR